MNIEVDTDELRNCENILYSSSEKLNVEISYWEDQISELTAIWSGTEANSFYNKIGNYINKLKALSNSQKQFGDAIKQCSINYDDSNNNLTEQLKNENSKYDD